MVLEQIAGTSGDVLLGIALTLIEVISEYIADAILFLLERMFA